MIRDLPPRARRAGNALAGTGRGGAARLPLRMIIGRGVIPQIQYTATPFMGCKVMLCLSVGDRYKCRI